MAEGYIKLDRKLLGSGILKNSAAWQVFGHLLLSSAWTRRQVDGVWLEPGESLSTCQEIADAIGLTYKQTRMGIDFLEKRQTLGKQMAKFRASGAAGEKSVYTLLNWAFYQGMKSKTDSQGKRVTSSRAGNGQAVGKPSSIVEEGKNATRAHARQDTPTHIGDSLKAIPTDMPPGFDTWPMAEQVAYWGTHTEKGKTDAN